MKRTRLILAAVALGALTLVPGALATTGGIFTANDPSFGSVVIGNTTGNTTVTITNSDATTHTIDTVSLGGTNPGQFNLVNDNCSTAVLAQNDTCTVGVKFAPTAPAGAKDARSMSPTTAAPPDRRVGARGYRDRSHPGGHGQRHRLRQRPGRRHQHQDADRHEQR